MTKAIRMMSENVRLVDGIIYLLDARAIASCINPTFDKIIGDKPVLYVVSKIDLVEKTDIDEWKAYFDKNGKNYVFINSLDNQSGSKVVARFNDMLKSVAEKYENKGVNKTLRGMVIGVPNSGKSTLINCIAKSKRAVTGDKAGVTKGKQWVTISNRLELLDTPGTLCPQFDSKRIAENIAFIGSINENILDVSDLCLLLIERLKEVAPTLLQDRYKLKDMEKTPLEIYEEICKNRGFLLKGGDFDYERCARAVIDDFRKQKIGKIILDKPKDVL